MLAIDPRFTATIHIRSGPVPFTPRSLDVERLEREGRENADRDAAMIAGRTKLDPLDPQYLLPEHAEAETTAINDRLRIHLERCDKLRTVIGDEPPVFTIQVPTPIERDQVNARMIGLGMQAISQQQQRAMMVEAMFEHDWKPEGFEIDNPDKAWSPEDNEAVATAHAEFLDGLWQREEAYNRARYEWQQQEAERIMDVWNGAPVREQADTPLGMISPRENARMVLLIDTLMATPRMRRMTEKQLDYERLQQLMLVRINLRAADGLKMPPLRVDPRDNALSKADAEMVRTALQEAYGPVIADQAWNELIDYINRLYTLDGFEVGNSDSPLENSRGPTSSNAPSGVSESSGGNSTESITGPAPGDASEKIIVSSSDTTTASPAGTVRSRSRMEEG